MRFERTASAFTANYFCERVFAIDGVRIHKAFGELRRRREGQRTILGIICGATGTMTCALSRDARTFGQKEAQRVPY